jgi:hypothetical protein
MTTTITPPTWSRLGLLALPLHGILLAYATRQGQPDQEADPEAWARFVSSPDYLIEHLLSNVVGPPLTISGTVALAIILTGTRAAHVAATGMVASVLGQLLLTVPGALSTFATPGIGSAYLAGNAEVMALEFPAILGPTLALAILLCVAGNVLLGIAVWRSSAFPRWTGAGWAVGSLTFFLLGAALGMATVGASLLTQPIGAVLMTISSAAMAWSAARRSPSRMGAGPSARASRMAHRPPTS